MKLIDLLNVMPEDEFLLVNVDVGGVMFSAYHSAGTFSSYKELSQKQVVTVYSGDEDVESKLINVKIQN